MTVWQIAAGKSGIDYSTVFIEHDVMFMGPGNPGEFPKGREKYPSKSKFDIVKNFAEGPKENDIVLLRFGKEIRAVGLVKSRYDWRPIFDDVLGWDLQHTRRVLWTRIGKGELKKLTGKEGIFTKALPLANTFSRANEFAHFESDLRNHVRKRKLKNLPYVSEPLSEEEIKGKLFDTGFPDYAINEILNTINASKALNKFYREKEEFRGQRPSEHEITAHIVTPLFEGLGWPKQLLGVEWNNIDLAIFRETPTTKDKCVVICEVKKPGSVNAVTYEQALKYIEKNKLDNASKIVTTDGQLIFVYQYRKKSRDAELKGYLNLSKIRERNVLPKNINSFETLVSLTRFGRI